MALSNSGGGFAGAGGAGNRGVTPASYSPQSADGAIQRGTPIEQKSVVSDIPLVSAGLLPNRNFLVTAGSLVPCVLQTAMDSTQPGFVSCIVPRDVLSDNGHVVLMEKGTRVLGEFHGGMQQGENRIFVVWNRAITPKGVSIVLGSPAADELGRAGMGGDVSTFFWRRFGGALLLSIVGDATAALSERMSSATMTARAPNQAAAAAVDNDVKIKPRLRAPQGAEMTIFVAKDLDFSNIYSLRLKR
nr:MULTISPECIES: type IV secretion system protein VirB10 [unclassified Novosphingobium]